MDSIRTINVTEDNFEKWVMQESKQRPVVVDFWAPWCGPCRTLGPLLENLAEQDQGRWLLAKINTEECPQLVSKYGVRGIPAVKAFVNEGIVEEFVGLQPEYQLRKWLDFFVPTEADQLVALGEKALKERAPERAFAFFEQALLIERNHYRAILGQAKFYIHQENFPKSLEVLDSIPAFARDDFSQEFAQLYLQAQGQMANQTNLTDMEKKIQQDPKNPEKYLQFGYALLAQKHYEKALFTLLEVVQMDKGKWREEARQTMVSVFEAVGHQSEMTQKFRSLLGQALFS